jgi:hypothetical protein
MFTFCRGWICGDFSIDAQSFFPSMIVAVRKIHSCTIRCLKHDTLQNCADSISLHLAVSHWKICSTFAESLLYRMKNVFLVLLWTAGTEKVLKAPLHQFVSLIFSCCLLSLLWLINLHTLRTLSSVTAAAQFYPDTTVFSAPSSSTFSTGPSSDITGGRFEVSSFHKLTGLSVVLFPAHRSSMNRLLKDKLFSWFSSCSRLCITL